ncbi:hypothetical protein HY837_06670 [archaeon]|nr:hypothetical protein [archaeon]
MMKNKITSTICALVLLTGCRTVGGTISGAVCKPVENSRTYDYHPKTITRKALLPPLIIAQTFASIPEGVIEGFYWGLQADFYYLENGEDPENYKWYEPWNRD